MERSPFAPESLPLLTPMRGVRLACVHAGIRYRHRNDMLLMVFDEGASVAGVYTRSLTAAAPVHWCRSACPDGTVRAILVNAGNANAYTGAQGREDVKAITGALAGELGCAPESIMMCSTGVIGEFLPRETMLRALPPLVGALTYDGWEAAAHAIMTTDTYPKMVTRRTLIGAKEITIHGIAKGSGMIAPDMATMLAYIVTDAALPANITQPLLARYCHRTFNSITVDSDTSTNDTLLMVATGKAQNIIPNSAGDPLLDDFKRALLEVMRELALLIIRDGEGITRLITVEVTGAEDNEAARRIGLSIANSPLVKTAIAAGDPNWGRIIAAAGKSGAWVDPDRLSLWLGAQRVTEGGCVSPDYREATAADHLRGQEVKITLDAGVGEGSATVWGCDLTETYIHINANYRS